METIELTSEYEDRRPPIIDTSKVKFPKLKRFSALCQAIQAVNFTDDNFPLLESICINQPCARDLEYFNTNLPNLKSMSFEHVVINDVDKFGASLSRSPKLETFISYKLWGLGSKAVHRLVLPNLTILNLYRSNDLRKLKLRAPKLQ